MIKRFKPDFSLSISHELAYMRETPEGGYVARGDYATLFSELESVKAERDAQQKRADALAVENAALKSLSIKLFNLGYLHGHESTVEGYFVDIHRNDIDTYHDDVVAEIIEDEEETPATDAALEAIRLEAKVEGIALAAIELDKFADKSSAQATTALKTAAVFLRIFILPELREAK
ncbi:Uncharacterised protein [Serratia proteamaculans]|uniref:hypothetical protein n=1 Tax=Serratia proteamaculans TaxID=28151 RepID=UPI002178BBBC|nr:hypothetical protein [Serratia proteamaculans]CAI0724587.1 Uncharacterised protein [Serratia proteamaculans]CAI1520619.1 Uncharacterised protein [Serratia proteamaculans]